MVTLKAKVAAHSPAISEVHVKAALDALRTSTLMRRANPLETLLLVEETLLDAALPDMEHIRAYVLAQILIEMIRNELFQTGCALGIDTSNTDRSQKAAHEAIQADALTRNTILLGWSWLYYRYVRVDLDIDVEAFCRAACINARTLQRYRQQAVSRLTFNLISREQMACRNSRKRRLYARLPTTLSPQLYGRDDALKYVEELSNRRALRHLQIIGARGVGKTVFARHLVRTLIDDEAIDYLIWIVAPASVDDLRRQIHCSLHDESFRVPVAVYFQSRRTAIVIDGIGSLLVNSSELQRLLCDLAAAVVILIGEEPLWSISLMNYVVLPELQETDAKQLIRYLLGQWHLPQCRTFAGEIDDIWEYTSGNPRAIVQAVWDMQAKQRKA